ncbi:MAG: ATP-binding protein [Bacteroidetes bacterium]|nr:ATP-binding protein [Bacteroidota bacterium]
MDVSFEARARTLDMLGRQQIAGNPTAISELFKNAHDADATRVEVDYYRSDGLFVMRDNGIGMKLNEFRDNWLTIATEASIQRKKRPRELTRGNRPILGEKGIGRLAIATIAPQVLVLTRANRNGILSDLTAAFLNWRFFECPELNLQDVLIQLQTFPGGRMPNGNDIAEMVSYFHEMNAQILERIDEEKRKQIQEDLNQFVVDPLSLASHLGEPTLLEQGHGTHFYLFPANSNLEYDIDGNPKSDEIAPLQKALLGFTTPSFGAENQSIIQTSFRVHSVDGSHHNFINENEFFTDDDYQNADHQIWGEFDKWGQFKGSISIYGEIVEQHIVNWSGGKGKSTDCGPFQIRFAAIEGAARHSTLPLPDHALMLAKTRKLGGLYIYRDGVRIQPYGNTDYDWLEIELRRTKSASYYYFSYRQMFGIVEVDSSNNPNLSEKAGREGFRENKAYRDLRDILKNFLVQVAADFFRSEGVHAEKFIIQKQELEKAELHRRARAKKVSVKRKKLKKDLSDFFEQIEQKDPVDEIMEIGIDAEKRIKQACCDQNRERVALLIQEIEQDLRKSLRDIESKYRVTKPQIGLSKSIMKDWYIYQDAHADILSSIKDVQDSVDSIISREIADAGVHLTFRERTEAALNDVKNYGERQTGSQSKKIMGEANRILGEARGVTKKWREAIETTFREVMSEFARQDLQGLDDQNLYAVRSSQEQVIQEVVNQSGQKLESILALLSAIEFNDDSSMLDEIAAIEESNISLKEQSVSDLQLIQLGMAIEIISHEFGAAIRAIRIGLRDLKEWANVNSELMPLFQNIRNGFDHLDGYLSLFTPLQRRLYRKEVTIHGWEIFRFLTNLFGQRLSRHHVELIQTDSFAKSTLKSYPSSVYPVFVNLVDNSIYWLSGQNERVERQIQLDESHGSFYVADSGPGIHVRDREDIFKIGFTKKPEGRGMGLHIARETLRQIGYRLILADQQRDWNTTFYISPIHDDH